jgi:hypothetical protein
MTTIQNCFDLTQAQNLKMILESCGIPTFIPDEFSAGIAPHLFMTSSGVRLQVADEHVDEAKMILDQESPTSTLDGLT